MKTKPFVITAAAVLLPFAGFAQTPPGPVPPAPPNAPAPPEPPESGHDKRPKVPVTFLGLETSEVPSVVSEQLGLAKGFGLVVDYVVPDGPAAAAGVRQNDILKMLNDQILTEPGQLAKLVRSFSEGTNVTLTILRKGIETKLTVKLAKREVPSRAGLPGFEKHWHFDQDFGQLGNEMRDLQRQLGDANQGVIHDAVEKAHREVMRAKEEAGRAARDVRISTSDENGTLKTTRIDLGKAQIVFSDGQGEMRIDSVDGKKVLTAKDPQGRLLFSGPIESKEDRDKMPAEVRQRFEKLEEKDLPAAVLPPSLQPDDEGIDSGRDSIDQVSLHRPFWPVGTVRI